MSGDVTTAIERLREAHAKSTPGEWKAGAGWVYLDTGIAGQWRYRNVLGEKHVLPPNSVPVLHGLNAEFIADAHNLLPILLAEAERLRAEREALHSDETRERLARMFARREGVMGSDWDDDYFIPFRAFYFARADAVLSVLSAGSEATS